MWRVQGAEQVPGPGPVVAEHRPQLVGGRGAGADLVLAQPHQGLQFPQARVGGLRAAQPVPVGAQVIGELVAVTRIGFGSRGSPPGPGRVKRGRVHRHHRMPGRQQPVDDQAAGLLDDHRQVAGVAVAAQTGKGHLPSRLGVRECPPVQHGAGVIEHRDIVSRTGPVPAGNTHPGLPAANSGRFHGAGPSAGSSLFGPRSGMSLNAGHGASARQGWQY